MVEALVRRTRRHAYVMTGSRTAGDRLLQQALMLRQCFDPAAPRLIDLLRDLYAVLPPVSLPDPDVEGLWGYLLGLPFYNRAALVLTRVDGLTDDEAAVVLGLDGAIVAELRAAARLADSMTEPARPR